jgi:diguanylate cyclase (GGDEF)-like protein
MVGGVSDPHVMPREDIVFTRQSWAAIWGRALAEKRTFYSTEPSPTPGNHDPITRALTAPIVHQEDVIGLLVVANKPTDYDEEDRQLVESAAAFIAPVLNARLERDTEEKARRQAEEALREQARRDPLTGILNHGAIVAELSRLVDSGDQTSQFAVAMVDVNGLKAINDKYGHQMGDAVLKAVARALSSEGILVGRYGGDEFVSILPGANRRKAERYRREVVRVMAGTDLTDPESGVKVTAMASIGLAFFPQDAHTLVDLVEMSDTAMYAEKRRRPTDRAA